MSTPDRPKRRRLSAEQRREVIERAATEVFAERGYRGASIDEIARRSHVTPPVIYDHFSSKENLHRHLLERQREALVALWSEHLLTDDPPDVRVPRALDAYYGYVEAHPYAWRMFFRETTGEPHIEEIHAEVVQGGRAMLAMLVARGAGLDQQALDPVALEMATEVVRTGLMGLAVWWREHPDVPRADVVAAAMNVVWIGFERAGRGETWRAASG